MSSDEEYLDAFVEEATAAARQNYIDETKIKTSANAISRKFKSLHAGLSEDEVKERFKKIFFPVMSHLNDDLNDEDKKVLRACLEIEFGIDYMDAFFGRRAPEEETAVPT